MKGEILLENMLNTKNIVPFDLKTNFICSKIAIEILNVSNIVQVNDN